MIEIKGKFITLTASLMSVYKDAIENADKMLFNETGKHWYELEPEGWYDTKHYRNFITAYIQASPSKENAFITLGKQIYSTVRKTVGFPPNLKTPIDYLEFESRTYLENLRGPEIKPRIFVQKKDGYVIIQTGMPEQDCKILEGVYMGIMKMAGISRGRIFQNKCIKNGDSYCEYHIIWKPQ